MLVDRAQNRLYATHGGTKTLTVLDLKTGAVRQVAAGDVAGVAVDAPDGKVFTGGGDQKVVVLDNKTLAKTGEIPVTGPVDDIKYDPKNGMVYAAHDDGAEDWVIDARTEKLVGTVAIPGAPEALAYDAGTDRLYQNIKPADCVDVIDPATEQGGRHLAHRPGQVAARAGDRPRHRAASSRRAATAIWPSWT